MLGPQDDYFHRKQFACSWKVNFTISPQADRMGFQLTGPRLEHAKGFNIVSDGIVDGHIQVPGSGQPIVLMRDRQTAGGYPKIATVISADLARFAQMRPGDEPCASRRWSGTRPSRRAQRLKDWIAALPSQLTPVRFTLTTEHLLSRNLIGGTVDALAPTADTIEQRAPLPRRPHRSISLRLDAALLGAVRRPCGLRLAAARVQDPLGIAVGLLARP